MFYFFSGTMSSVGNPRDRTLKTKYSKGFKLPQFSAVHSCGSIEAQVQRMAGIFGIRVFRSSFLRLH